MDNYRATEMEPGIVRLELTRPHRRNALSSDAVAKLHREIDRIGGDPAIRVVILTGEGPSSDGHRRKPTADGTSTRQNHGMLVEISCGTREPECLQGR
ncbi:MAG TPA: hypothetical protein VN888_18625 [Mycobacterium sp.]|nr:hypothetical protein [Mycobacterium sp.]